jgi:hypothetical protein
VKKAVALSWTVPRHQRQPDFTNHTHREYITVIKRNTTPTLTKTGCVLQHHGLLECPLTWLRSSEMDMPKSIFWIFHPFNLSCIPQLNRSICIPPICRTFLSRQRKPLLSMPVHKPFGFLYVTKRTKKAVDVKKSRHNVFNIG